MGHGHCGGCEAALSQANEGYAAAAKAGLSLIGSSYWTIARSKVVTDHIDSDPHPRYSTCYGT